MLRRLFAILAFLVLVPAAGFCAGADIYIGVAAGADASRIKLAIAPFAAEREGVGEDVEVAARFQEIVRADLLYSRYFAIPDTGPVENPRKLKKLLASWKKTGAQYLLAASTADLGNIWTFSGRLYDLNSGDTVAEKYYKGDPASLRRAAHKFADEVVWRLTGKKGVAQTRLAFANNGSGAKEIYVVDYDGRNMLRLTNDRSISLFPRWAPDGEKIYYTSYRYRNPDAFVIDLRGRTIKPVSSQQGLNIPGGVSPDGSKMVITLSRSANPHIYEMDIATKGLTRLTSGADNVDSSASYSPDGKFVTFVSDRSGNPQIYILELATGRTQRLTRMNWSDTPRWSPNGEWIAFAGRVKAEDNMDIFLVDITGSQLRQLTRDAAFNEDPTWSPDGRFLAFTTTRNAPLRQIFVMDADGSAPHVVADLPGKSFTPAWGPVPQ